MACFRYISRLGQAIKDGRPEPGHIVVHSALDVVQALLNSDVVGKLGFQEGALAIAIRNKFAVASAVASHRFVTTYNDRDKAMAIYKDDKASLAKWFEEVQGKRLEAALVGPCVELNEREAGLLKRCLDGCTDPTNYKFFPESLFNNFTICLLQPILIALDSPLTAEDPMPTIDPIQLPEAQTILPMAPPVSN